MGFPRGVLFSRFWRFAFVARAAERRGAKDGESSGGRKTLNGMLFGAPES